MGLQAQLWRGIAAFRFASLAYAAVLLVVDRADYRRLVLAWAVGYGRRAGMTAAVILGLCDIARHRRAGPRRVPAAGRRPAARRPCRAAAHRA